MKSSSKSNRREFLKESGSLAAAAAAVSWPAINASLQGAVTGANERIRMGFIGVGNRGSQLLSLFMRHADVEVTALCDVYQPYTERDFSRVHPRYIQELGGRIPRMGEQFIRSPKRFRDYRRLLEQPDIDAVCIATPDHWHALQTLHALDAGKDIYVEKPLTIALGEGRRMVEATHQSNQIVQVGLNRRGSTLYQELARTVPQGEIGRVTSARAYRISNMAPHGIGRAHPEPPPPDLDWDLWLGPRAYRPYQYNIAPYKFRWWRDFSTQMGNWGVHYMDVCRWLMGEKAPAAVSATGGRYAIDDDRDIPDTMHVTFEFASGAMINFGIFEASGGSMIIDGEVELSGSQANLVCQERRYQIIPSRPGQFQDWTDSVPARKRVLERPEQSDGNLIRNFLDTVKSRDRSQLWCDIETGHRSTSFAHLANIALATGSRLEWDADQERFTNHEAANRMLNYEYRAPWRL